MRSGHAIKISFSLKGLAVKTLLSRLTIYLLTALIIILCARGALVPIFNNSQFHDALKSFFDCVKSVVYDFFSPKLTSNVTSVELQQKFMDVVSFFSVHKAGILWSMVAIFFAVQFAVFCASVNDYVIAINVNNYMTTLMNCKFFPTLFEHFDDAVKYAFYKTVCLLIYNVLVYGICYLLSLLFYNAFNLLGLFFISLTLFITATLRFSLSGHVLPKMICEGKKPFKALIECLREIKSDIFKLFDRFGIYFLVIVSSFVFNVIGAIATFFVSLLVTLPLSILIFSSIKFVGYYVEHKKKYFITYDEIYVPKELRKNDEKLLNKIDI